MDAAQTLLDIEQIKQLKHRYFRCVDTKDWDGLTDCFVPEATATYPRHPCANRDDILAFLTRLMVPEMVTMHQGHHPEIAVEGDTATGVWHLHDKVIVPAFDYSLEGAAIYRDRYVRTEDGWKLSHTEYDRLFETSWKLSAIEGYTVNQGEISKGTASA